MTRFLRVAAVLVALASASLMIVAVIAPTESSWSVLGLAWPLPNILVGLVLTFRRPRLVVGWLFAAIGFLVTSGMLADRVSEATLGYGVSAPWWGVAAAWYGEWYWISLIYITLVFLPLLFPTGSAPSPRLGVVTRFIVGVFTLATVAAALQERLDTPEGRWVPNPIGITGLGDVEEGAIGPVMLVVTLACLATAFTGLVGRFRRGRGVERQQIKWFTSAGVVLILGFVAQGIIEGIFGARIVALDVTLFALPPIAAGVAVFRYRLYAIDRIISRTVTYGLVTALLVAVYAGAVALMSAAIDPLAGESPLAVAVATLAAAAVFRPALTWIRSAVDRRFNRERYDAARTVAGFRERVRTDMDLERLCADLVTVADETFEPQTTAVWLRPAQETRA